MAKKEYREYLKSDRWQFVRQCALDFAENRCQLCNDVDDLHVHHRKYPKVYGDEPINDLVVLCKRCHDLFHHNCNLKNQNGMKMTRRQRKEKKKLRREATKPA